MEASGRFRLRAVWAERKSLLDRYMLASGGGEKENGRVLRPPGEGPQRSGRDWLTVHVQALSLVLQSHHLLGLAGQGLEPAQASTSGPLGLLGRSVGQQVVQVLGQIVGLWITQSEKQGETRTAAEDMGHSWTHGHH